MELSFSTAQNGLFAANFRQGTIAHNLSNLTTPGYKTLREDQETMDNPGTRIQATRRDFSEGAPKATGQPQHLYIAGEGFFQVERDGEPGYTRVGNFHIDEEGDFVTPSGYRLDPNITVPDDSSGLRVTSDGVVYSIDSEGAAEEIGTLELTRFQNPNGLTTIGDNLYMEGPNSGSPLNGSPGEDGFGSVLQSHIEQSNVDPAAEISEQIVNQRYYQLNLRVFQTSDELVGRAVDLFR